MHLWLRGSTFWFSLRVPRRHIAAYGGTPIRIRLGQLPAIEARRRACLLAAHTDVGMELGMDRDTLIRSLAALSAQIAEVRREAFGAGVRALPGRYSGDELRCDPDLARDEEIRRNIHIERRKTLEGILVRLEVVRRALDEDTLVWEAQRKTYERTIAAVYRTAAELNAQVPASSTEAAPPSALLQPPREGDAPGDEPIVTRDTLLSAAATPVVEKRCEALSSRGTNRYADHVRHSLRTFLEIAGDKQLRRYVPADLQEYVNVLARVPSNLSKLQQFRGMGLRDAAVANARLKEPRPCMAEKTIEKYLTEVRLIWQCATASVPDVRDIGAGSVTMPRSAAPALDREGLPPPVLSKWFAEAARHREPHLRWLPVLGLLTGMRLGEIVFLQPGDFVEYEGFQAIDLRRFNDRHRHVKTKESLRVVPIHPMLHEVGFTSWMLTQKGKWLFPVFHDAADPADSAQKRMAYWMKSLGIHVPQIATYHSLRHSAKAWLRAIAGDRIADLMQGHSLPTVGGKYGFGLLQAEEIEKIVTGAPPRDVDFGPYAISGPGLRRSRARRASSNG